MSELENIKNNQEVETIPTDNTTEELQENVEETTGEVSGEVSGEVVEVPVVEEEQPLEEPQPIQQVDGLYYYDKLYEDGHLGQFTASTALAYAMGWQDNIIEQVNTEKGYNGWTYVKGKAPVKGLDLVKAEKLNEISAIADAFEQMKCDSMYVTSSLGFRVNADRRSLQNIENMITLGESQQFKDYDNTFHYLSVDELKIIANEIIINGLNLYSQKFAMQQAVTSATEVEAIANLDLTFNMMDFSTH